LDRRHVFRRERPRLHDAADADARISPTPHDHLGLSRSAVGVEAMEASGGTEAQHRCWAGEIECRPALRPVIERVVSEAIDAPAE
jgi:hypothetical protein